MTQILTINTGSSSLKIALYEQGRDETRTLSGSVDRIGLPGGRFRLADEHDAILLDQAGDFSDHGAALETVLAWLRSQRPGLKLGAIGHRVVHGGMKYREPGRITPEMIAYLQLSIALAPNHLPQAIEHHTFKDPIR